MSLGDGFHFAYICILPPQIKPGKYANAEAQVMAEVFIVITSGSSTLQRLRRTGVTATSGGLGVGREERVEAEGVCVEKKVCKRLLFSFGIVNTRMPLIHLQYRSTVACQKKKEKDSITAITPYWLL